MGRVPAEEVGDRNSWGGTGWECVAGPGNVGAGSGGSSAAREVQLPGDELPVTLRFTKM